MSASMILRCPFLRLPGAAVAAVISMLVVAAPYQALAGACGDDVGGQRVACKCGDNVVSDTVLGSSDPIVSEPCSGDGLVVLVPSGSDGITLSLGGNSMVGSGSGTGIRVAHGGRLGSAIIGGDAGDTRAEIANFGTGIRASGRLAVREVRSIDIHANRDDGLKIRSSGVRVEDVRSERNGRNGVALSGHGIEVSGVVAAGNIRDGLKVRGAGANIDAETTGNRRNGTVIGGRGSRASKIRSTDNGGAGVVATGEGHAVADLQASGNAAGEVAGRAGALQ